MKDKKFAVLCGLGLTWLVMFIAMLCGARIHPRIELLVTVICVCWFAFWTLSTLRSMYRKEKPTVTQPTTGTSTNAKAKKTPKSE